MRSKSRAKSVRLGRWLNPYSAAQQSRFSNLLPRCAWALTRALLSRVRKPRRFSQCLAVPLALTIGFFALLPSSYRFFLSARIFLQTPLRRYPVSIFDGIALFLSTIREKKNRYSEPFPRSLLRFVKSAFLWFAPKRERPWWKLARKAPLIGIDVSAF